MFDFVKIYFMSWYCVFYPVFAFLVWHTFTFYQQETWLLMISSQKSGLCSILRYDYMKNTLKIGWYYGVEY